MKKKIIAAIVAPIAIATGWTACAANDNSATDAAKYATTHPVVTVTAPTKPAPTVTATVTTTATVAQVPQSCLDALDNADTGFTYAGQILNAASQLDADTMNALTDKLTQLAPIYNANKTACRQAGGQ